MGLDSDTLTSTWTHLHLISDTDTEGYGVEYLSWRLQFHGLNGHVVGGNLDFW